MCGLVAPATAEEGPPPSDDPVAWRHLQTQATQGDSTMSREISQLGCYEKWLVREVNVIGVY